MVRVPLPSRLKSGHGHGHGTSSEPPSAQPSRASSPAPPSKSGSGHSSTLGQLVLSAKVIKARNLAAKDKSGYSDPDLVLTLGDSRQSTVSIPKTLNPEWNETLDFGVAGINTLLLEVVCWDKDRFRKDYMGEFDVPLEDIFSNGTVRTEPTWYPLESRKTGKKKSVVTGEVLLGFSLHDPSNASATDSQIHQRLTGIVADDPDAAFDDDDDLIGRPESNELDEDDPDREDSLSSLEEPAGTAETSEKRKRRRRLARLKRKATQKAYEFSGVSDLAGVLFLEISRITDLPPERNMTRTSFDMDPFVVTSLGKKTFRTKVIRHNLNPVYDEKLVFQVARHETNYSLTFSVVDRDKLSGNDFIGTCNLPLEKISVFSPEADGTTGLYPLRELSSTGRPQLETKKSRFRIPLSRSSSSSNVSRMAAKDSSFQSISSGQASLDPATATITPSPPSSHNAHFAVPQEHQALPHINSAEPNGHEDPDLKTFDIPLTLKNKDRWEAKHKPVLFLKAKYVPYRALRQQFWRAMLRQYDADESGVMNKVELTVMLDTLGSTLHESTIDGFFKRFENENNFKEEALTFDQAVICLEDWLQSVEGRRVGRRAAQRSPKVGAPGASPGMHSSGFDSDGYSTASGLNTPSLSKTEHNPIPRLVHEHHGTRGEEGDALDSNDLAEEGGEEHIVEIRECPICHQPRLTKRSDADIITHIATCASQDWRQVNNIVMSGFVTSSQAQRKWYSKVITKIGYGGYKLGANSANILVQDRITGQINEERMSVYVRLGIRLLYKGLKSRDMEKKRIRKLLRSLSFKQGRKFDDPASASQIASFINFHQLDMSEVLRPTDQFKNFNEFFYRELKPEARPCSAPDRPQIITSPADCRTVVFNTIEEAQGIWVKGREFTVERLLGNAYPNDAKRYTRGGSLGIFRLAPQDYHRFHIPVDGIMGEPKLIDGEYYTVNPMAIRSALDVYGENIRVVVPIDSETHGRVMVICVGAMMVGSTVITRKAGENVSRAEELGYFKFGGSTILLLFEPGVMVFDEDLVDNSRGALETLIRVGMSIGHSKESAPHTADMRKDGEFTREEKEDAERKIGGSLGPSTIIPSMAEFK